MRWLKVTASYLIKRDYYCLSRSEYIRIATDPTFRPDDTPSLKHNQVTSIGHFLEICSKITFH